MFVKVSADRQRHAGRPRQLPRLQAGGRGRPGAGSTRSAGRSPASPNCPTRQTAWIYEQALRRGPRSRKTGLAAEPRHHDREGQAARLDRRAEARRSRRTSSGWSQHDPGIRHFRSPRPQRPAARRLLRGAAEGHRGVRPRRLLRLSRRRAPLHAARHGAVAERVPLGDRAAHQAAALRHLRLCAADPSSAADAGGNLHARSHERRTAGDRLRPRLGAVRDFLLRAERRGAPANLCRAAGADPQGIHGRRS